MRQRMKRKRILGICLLLLVLLMTARGINENVPLGTVQEFQSNVQQDELEVQEFQSTAEIVESEKEEAHSYLACMLDFPDYYGRCFP